MTEEQETYDPILIALSGSAGAGKDTIAEAASLHRMSFAEPMYQMMETATGLTRDDISALKHGRFTRNSLSVLPMELLELGPEECNRRVRRIMQRLGTDLLRDDYSNNVWVENLARRTNAFLAHVYTNYRTFQEAEIVVARGVGVTDARFRNEVEALRDMGFLCVYVDAPEKFLRLKPCANRLMRWLGERYPALVFRLTGNGYYHPSEAEGRRMREEGAYDLVIMNDRSLTPEELGQRLVEWYEKLRPREVRS